MLRTLGAAGEAQWVPEVSLAQAEMNARAVWGAVAVPGEDAATAPRRGHVKQSSNQLTALPPTGG
jgi:hypothetical protein